MIKLFFKAYSSLLFSKSLLLGVLLFLLSLVNPLVALSGTLAVLVSLAFAHLLKIDTKALSQGFYLYNSLLLGMGMGYLYLPTFSMFTMLIVLSIFTFLLSLLLSKIMLKKGLAILSIPFMIVYYLLFVVNVAYPLLLPSNLPHVIVIDMEFPLILSALFKAIGSIFFLPHNIVGLGILLFLLLHSRILFMLSITGFYTGVFSHALIIDSLTDALNNIYNFNYSITALALGAIFLLPTLQNFFLALLAVLCTVVISHFMNQFIDHYLLTLPFNLVVTSFLLLLYALKYQAFNYFPLSTPEASLGQYLSNLKRFSPRTIQLILPFSGAWQVSQAFNGKWTHKGLWQYAYDFMISKKGSTSHNSGKLLEEYHAFGQAILSPVNGIVIACDDSLIDNPIGTVNQQENWGNYIILQTYDGFYIEISHLMQYSLQVQVGDSVQIHTPLAKCGNSGYSFEPHIHLQVQKTPFLASETLSFCFYESQQGTDLSFHTLPKTGDIINPVALNLAVAEQFSMTVDESYAYAVYQKGRFKENFSFCVKINDQGEHYFEETHGNRLFFYKTHTQFYCYRYEGSKSYLKYIYALMPRVPLSKATSHYQDYLPSDLFYSKFNTIISQFKMSFFSHDYMIAIDYTWEKNILTSTYGNVIFSEKHKLFSYLCYENLELKSL